MKKWLVHWSAQVEEYDTEFVYYKDLLNSMANAIVDLIIDHFSLKVVEQQQMTDVSPTK